MTTEGSRVITTPKGAGLWFSVGAAVLLVLALVPPLSSSATRYSLFEAVQYCLLGIVAPAFLVLGAPWRALALGRLLERLELRWHVRATSSRVWVTVVPALTILVLWRAPDLVDRLAQSYWLMLAEAATLVPAGTIIWLECVSSPPLSPRLAHPGRLAVAAVTMWVIWVAGYVVGLGNAAPYPVYAGHAHRAFSAAADQQLTAGLLWFVASCAFLPVVFVNLVAWLCSAPLSPSENTR
ncbi:MAG: cytochrome c oxidase assembly protein [Acidimicrobiales bacterium]